jgi:adenylosuccinate synthase
VVGLQWGDEGKGKVVDYLADRFDAVARFNGGSNAGHSVVVGTKRYTFHLVPSGALKGKELLIGAGVVLDPRVLTEDLKMFPPAKGRLMVDENCTLVSPLEQAFDGFLEDMRGAAALGTTRRGIGPAYAMRALRLAPRVLDLLKDFDSHDIVAFYRKLGIHAEHLRSWASESRSLLQGLAGDVGGRVVEIQSEGGSILFEASQGTLLDLFHGSYPYVTSTHTLVSYVPAALGIPPSAAKDSLGVLKCYTTRVGSGPFPTELKNATGEKIRKLGNEYGSTTGRPRRVGWIDLVALKYAVVLNGINKVAVTKLDVLSSVKEFKACTAYRIDGSETTNFRKALARLDDARPVYESPFSMHGATYGGTLPHQAKALVEYLEGALDVEVVLLSHSQERSKTIEL